MSKPSRTIFRLPVLASVVLLVGLCTSATYWLLHLSGSPQRPLAAAPSTPAPQINSTATAQLFGRSAAAASNYQLKGIVLAYIDTDSVAIIAADGKPAQAIKLGNEISTGVRLLEIHADHILLSDNGVQKRVQLPQSTRQDNLVSK